MKISIPQEMLELVHDRDLRSCIEFIAAIDALKGVLRKTSPIGLDRRENTAEHSWHLVVMAMVLQRYAAEPVDIGRVIKMLALHDLGEIHAGDVFLYAADRGESQEKERAAVAALFEPLPAGPRAEFESLWSEFAAGETAEARYAQAMDRFQPFISNLANAGGNWKSMGIGKDQALARNSHIGDGAPALWEVYRIVADEADRHGFFADSVPVP